MAQKTLRIAVQVETNRAHGRGMLEGIADTALSFGDWRLEPVEPRLLTDPANVRRYDGLIVRVMDNATVDALVKAGRPVVDTYGRLDPNPLPFIRLDDAVIAACAAECFAEHRYIRCAEGLGSSPSRECKVENGKWKIKRCINSHHVLQPSRSPSELQTILCTQIQLTGIPPLTGILCAATAQASMLFRRIPSTLWTSSR